MEVRVEDGQMFRGTAAQDQILADGKASFLRRHRFSLIAGAGVCLLLILLVSAALHQRGARVSVSRSRVSVATVQRGTFIADVAAEGRIVAAVSPTLYAPANGSLTLLVHAGDKVSKGQVLVRLESPDLAARLTQERATLQSEQLEYQRAQLEAQMQLRNSRDAADEAKVDRNTARRELQRSDKAHQLGAYSELQLIRAQGALEKAEFALAEATRKLAAQPEENRFNVDGHKAALDRQESLVSELQRQVDAMSVRSPVDGQVGRVQIADRAVVAKDTPLLTVVDLSALEVEILTPESFARDLAIGMPAHVSGNGGEWQGRVSAVSPEVVSGQVTARVSFDGKASPGLRQNQRMSVRIVLDSRKNVLMVDRGTFIDQDGTEVAYLVHGNVAERHPIRTGAVSVGKVEIAAGLKEEDQIVISGTEAFGGAERVILSN
jgi:HlyD family secretion protein